MPKNIMTRINYHVDRTKTIEYNNSNNLYVDIVSDMNDKHDIHRAGIIPYIRLDNGNVWYCLGIDDKSGDLSDFGGGVEKRDKGNYQLTAIREFDEETLGVFGTLSIRDIYNSYVIFYAHTAIIFLRINLDIESFKYYQEEFKLRRDGLHKQTEMRDIAWISNDHILSRPRIYDKIHKQLRFFCNLNI